MKTSVQFISGIVATLLVGAGGFVMYSGMQLSKSSELVATSTPRTTLPSSTESTTALPKPNGDIDTALQAFEEETVSESKSALATDAEKSLISVDAFAVTSFSDAYDQSLF